MADDHGTNVTTFIARLTEALGPKGVSTDAHEIAPTSRTGAAAGRAPRPCW